MAQRKKKAVGSLLAKASTKTVKKLLDETKKHADDLQTKPTKGQKAINKATKGQRANRESVRKTAAVTGVSAVAILEGPEAVEKLYDTLNETEQERFRKEFSLATKKGLDVFDFTNNKGKTYSVKVSIASGDDSDTVYEMKKSRDKKAVGSVAQRATEGAGSLLAAAQEDVNMINKGVDAETSRLEPIKEGLMSNIQSGPRVADNVGAEEDALKLPTEILDAIWFSENEMPPVNEEEAVQFEVAVVDALVQDEPAFEFKDKIYSLDKAAKETIIEAVVDQEREQLFIGGLLKKLSKKFLERMNPEMKAIPANSLIKNIDKFKFKGKGGFLGALFSLMKNNQKGSYIKFNDSPLVNFVTLNKKDNQTSEIDPSISQAADAMGQELKGNNLEMRNNFNEGGMPVDTYPNIPPEEMAAAKASQLPDDQMEEAHEEFILDEALNPRDQDYLGSILEQDERLSIIFDRVMDVATEFSGAGAVKGMGTGVSDSIPARLSDGEFVFTKKAVDQIGVETLQKLMDDAERAFDRANGREVRQEGGMMMSNVEKETPTSFLNDYELSDEVKQIMINANQMPSAMPKAT